MIKFVSIVALCLGLSLNVFARGDAKGRGWESGASGHVNCRQEIFKVCTKYGRGRSAQVKCLDENRKQLPAECANKLDRVKKNKSPIPQICQADAEKFCPELSYDVVPTMHCLKRFKQEISPACGAKFKSPRSMAKKK